MDSVTQVALGAAVGEAVAGREAGNKAPMWGAVLGTLPDLDILANPFLTEAQALTFHRSVSHSFVFVAAAVLCVAVGLHRLHNTLPVSRKRWAGLAAAVLLTHVGLDCLTSYGTQVFWPFSRYPVILGTIFVIDPLYTIPLAAGLLLSFRWPPTSRPRRWSTYVGLALSSTYLLLTMGNKLYVNDVFEEAVARQVPTAERILTRPTPFNNLLWWGIAEVEDGYHVGLYSLLDEAPHIRFRYVPKRHELLGDATDNPIVERVRRFSRGYFSVRRGTDGALLIHDLRFGRNDLGLTEHGEYLFTFQLETDSAGSVVDLRQRETPLRLNGPLLRLYLSRIAGETVDDPRKTMSTPIPPFEATASPPPLDAD